MRNKAVIVADDDPSRARHLVTWLRACGITAYTPSRDCRDTSTLAMIRELQPRLVVCRPGTTGIALFRPLCAMREPPMVILLQENSQAQDEVLHIEELIVASIRTPVPMPGLCAYIRSALAIIAELDAPALSRTVGSREVPTVGHVVSAATRALQSMARELH
jgi:DNA-binding response OmpR family regulator